MKKAKVKKFIKIFFITIASFIILFFILLGTYVIYNWQGVIKPFQVGNPKAENKILIASQGSEFKTILLNQIIERIKNNDNYLYIVDCTKLDKESGAEWDAIVIIHSAQMHEMPGAAENFLDRGIDLAKVMLVSTSGAGDDKVEKYEVDAISTASRISVTSKIVDMLIPKIETRLLVKN